MPRWLHAPLGRLSRAGTRAARASNALGLRWRLFLLVLVALLPGLALILHLGMEQRRQVRARAGEQVERLADLVAEHGQRNLDLARAVLIGLGHAPQAESLDAEGCSQAAAGILEHFPLLASIGAADAEGRPFCRAVGGAEGMGPSAAGRPHLERALSTRELALGVHRPGGEAYPATIPLAYPIVVGGEVRGAAFGAVDLAVVQAQLDALSLPAEAVVTLMDRSGVVLARRPDGPRWTGSAAAGLLASRVLAGDAVVEAEDLDGARRLFAFRSVAVAGVATGLYVAAGIPEDVAGAAESALFHEVLRSYLVACACALVLALVVGELGLVRNVRAVIAAARRLSSGEYGARANRSSAGGELGELASAFDHMARSLESLTREEMSILEFAGDGILRLDPEGRVTYANPAAVRMLGGRGGETLGRRVNGLACGRDECVGGCVLARSLRDGVVHQGVDERFVDADGGTFAAEYVTTPIHHGDVVAGAVVVFRDVTARRRMEEKLRHSEKVQAIGQLAGGVAHDFNNILAAIMACARFVRDELPPGHPSRPDVEEILSSTQRGAALTRQLLTFCRREVVEPRVLDLGAVVSGVQSFLRRLIGEDVQIRVDADPGCHVEADPGQLEQVIVNLVVNARDAMPAGGRIDITVRKEASPPETAAGEEGGLPEGPTVALTVADTGTGIEPTVARRIFEPFFTTKPAGKGTGLGLSTVYQVAIQSGGTVRVRSSPGRGASFTVYLPCCEDLPAATIVSVGARHRGCERVLLVEDDDVLRVLVRRTLVAAGYTVLDASRPGAALTLARDAAIDLLVADVILPDMSGPELAARVAAAAPGLRVLYMSGYTGGRLVADEVAASGAAFLAKPFTPDALLARVREILGSPPAAAAPSEEAKAAGQ